MTVNLNIVEKCVSCLNIKESYDLARRMEQEKTNPVLGYRTAGSLAEDVYKRQQKAELVLKEMRIGLCNGGLLGILSFVLIGLYIFLFKGKTLVFAYAVSGCIGLSLLVAMLVSSAVGTCIPLFFKKVGVDPAVASGPLITTVNDLVAVITRCV